MVATGRLIIFDAVEFLPLYVDQRQIMLLGKRGSYSTLKKPNSDVIFKRHNVKLELR